MKLNFTREMGINPPCSYVCTWIHKPTSLQPLEGKRAGNKGD